MDRAGQGRAKGGARLRVLVCALGYAPAAPAGAERQAQLQAEEMARRGHRVEVVCPRVPGFASGVINGVVVTRLPLVARRHAASLTYIPTLTAYLTCRLRENDAVMVHLGHYQADAAVLAARLVGRPSWVRLAGSGPIGEIFRMRHAARVTRYYGLRHATRVQAMSNDQMAEATAVGVDRHRLVQISNGVDVSAWPPPSAASKRDARRRLGLDEHGHVALYVGRFARAKGIEDLLHAWRGVDHPSSTLLMVGSTNTLDAVGPLPAQARVVVHPRTEDLHPYYAAADLLVLPSRSSEGMSNALLEAMACSLPVIATDVGAASAMITQGIDGVVVPPWSAPALQAAMTHLLRDPARGVAMGQAARCTVAERYDIRMVMDRIVADLRTLVHTRRSA